MLGLTRICSHVNKQGFKVYVAGSGELQRRDTQSNSVRPALVSKVINFWHVPVNYLIGLLISSMSQTPFSKTLATLWGGFHETVKQMGFK